MHAIHDSAGLWTLAWRRLQADKVAMAALAANPEAAQQLAQEQKGTTNISPADLEQMLKTIQELSASGNREMAAQMMAMLQSMMENMRVTKSSGGDTSPQGKALNQAIQKLGEMMGQQRALLVRLELDRPIRPAHHKRSEDAELQGFTQL